MQRAKAALATLLMLFAALLASDLLARAVFPEPEVPGFNRILFTNVGVFGGLDEVSRFGGSPRTDLSGAPRRALRNVQIAWISDPDGIYELVTLNLYGSRGKDFDVEKAAGTTRIVFLGDSFVEGLGAADQETIPEAFRRALDLPDVEVSNLGIGGSGLVALAGLASVAIPLLAPDHVMVVLYSNDLPAPLLRPEDLPPPGYVPLRRPWWTPRLLTVALELAAESTPALFYHRGPFPFFRPVPHPSNPLSSSRAPPGVPDALVDAMRAGRFNPFTVSSKRTLEEQLLGPFDYRSGGSHLAHIRRVSTENGAQLMLGHVPVNVTVSDRYLQFWQALGERFSVESLMESEFREQQRWLSRMALEMGVPFVDSTAVLEREEASGRPMYADLRLAHDAWRLRARRRGTGSSVPKRVALSVQPAGGACVALG